MYAIFVGLEVKADSVDAFIQASITEGQGVVSEEEGCFRFDVLRDGEKPNIFYFYEVFRDESAAEAHWQTEIFKRWQQAVDPMIEATHVEKISMQTIFPSEKGLELQKHGLLNW